MVFMCVPESFAGLLKQKGWRRGWHNDIEPLGTTLARAVSQFKDALDAKNKAKGVKGTSGNSDFQCQYPLLG